MCLGTLLVALDGQVIRTWGVNSFLFGFSNHINIANTRDKKIFCVSIVINCIRQNFTKSNLSTLHLLCLAHLLFETIMQADVEREPEKNDFWCQYWEFMNYPDFQKSDMTIYLPHCPQIPSIVFQCLIPALKNTCL